MKRLISIVVASLLANTALAITPNQPDLEVIKQTPAGMGTHPGTLYRQEIGQPGDAPDKAVFIIDVWGAGAKADKNSKDSMETYRMMGRQYGYLLNKANLPPQYQNLSLESFYNELHDKIHKSEWFLDIIFLYDSITKISLEPGLFYGPRIPPRELALIEGAAETSGLTKKQLVFLDQMFLFTFLTHVIPVQKPEVQAHIFDQPVDLQPAQNVAPFGCSTLAVWDKYTKNHQMLFARNFDWTKTLHGLFAGRTLVGVFHPDNGDNSIALIGYPGWFFSDTGINDKGVFVEMNSGWYSSYTMNVTRYTKSYADLLSDMLYTSKNYDELYNAVATSIPDISYVIIGTDGNKIFAAEEKSVGMLGKFFTPSYVRMRVPGSESHYRNDPISEDVLVVSNSFRLADWDTKYHLLVPNPYPQDESTSYPLTRYDNLLKQARYNHGIITLETMQDIMERSLMLNSDQGGATGYEGTLDNKPAAVTYFSLVAAPDQNGKLFDWWLRMPDVHNQCIDGYKCQHLGWVNVDLNYFFKSAH